ncbi:MAG: hypothetical protein JWM31_290, partial [Solirubrobacterales bacterium]|nr:hypothetical protein [Solirubrobacterales bacterium]
MSEITRPQFAVAALVVALLAWAAGRALVPAGAGAGDGGVNAGLAAPASVAA